MTLRRFGSQQVPSCARRHGDEGVWWKKADIDPTLNARALWLQTHPLPETSANKRHSRDPCDVTEAIIQGIFPWCFAPELYARAVIK